MNHLEKKLLEGCNPDLLEYIKGLFTSASGNTEIMSDLINQEHFDAAKQMSPRVLHSLASFLEKLDGMEHFARHGEELKMDMMNKTVVVTPTELEPAPIEPAPVEPAPVEAAPEPVAQPEPAVVEAVEAAPTPAGEQLV